MKQITNFLFVQIFRSVFLFAPLVLTLLACGASDRKKEAQANAASTPRPPAAVDVYLVQTSTLTDALELPGTLVADQATEIHPEVAGRIVALNVREGTYVGKGTVLARLYAGDLAAQQQKLAVQLRIARQTENRYAQLQKIGGISKQDYDVTTLQVSNLQADMAIVQTEMAKRVIRAPFSGKLGFKAVSEGAYVTPASVITTIQKTAGLRLDFSVPERYIAKLNTGDFVNFSVEGTKRAYSAVVIATEPGIAQTTRTLTVRARVSGNEQGLVPGAFAKVQLQFGADQDALMVPSQAIIPQARGKKVYVLSGGKARAVDVTTGLRDSARVQVTSGLNKGDTIIITGLMSLKPDAPVRLRKLVNPTNP